MSKGSDDVVIVELDEVVFVVGVVGAFGAFEAFGSGKDLFLKTKLVDSV